MCVLHACFLLGCGISEKYKFHFIFEFDFNRKDKRIGKIVFFNTQESNNLMLKSIRGPKFVPSWTAKINSELVNGSILWSQNRCYGNLCNRSVGLNSNTLLFAWREEPSKKSILVFTSSTTMAIVLPYHFWFRWQISVFCVCS